jgi:hypothetical protein
MSLYSKRLQPIAQPEEKLGALSFGSRVHTVSVIPIVPVESNPLGKWDLP